MARYRFIENGNKIICLSTYAKKIVRGIAKCSPNDTFSSTVGQRLAQLRCDQKIAEKRMNRAYEKYMEARDYLFDAQDYFNDMNDYYKESCMKYDEVNRLLYEFEKNI